MKMNYKKAGVNIDAGNEAVDKIKNEVKKNFYKKCSYQLRKFWFII